MDFLGSVWSVFGVDRSRYIAADRLPPVESMRPDKPRPYRVSGSGTAVNSGLIASLDTNSETTGSKWYGSLGSNGISAKMMLHPHVKQSVAYVTNPLQSATWRFKPASGSALDREIADFCTHVFLECLPWDMILERMVGGAAQDGFSVSEMTDDLRPVAADRFPLHPRPAAAMVPTALHEVPANTVDYWHKRKDAPTQLESIDQWQPFSDGEDPGYRNVKADRLVRMTFGQSGSNFAGIAILRSAYAPWKILDMFETYRAIVVERTACGTPLAIASEDMTTDEIDAVESVLENMRTMAKGAAVLPNGSTVEWSGAGENDLANLNIAIEALKTDLAINVTAGFSRLGLVGPGSYALANTQSGQYHLSTIGRAKLVSIVFTLGLDGWSPVRRIVEANYGPGVSIPILEARNLPTRDVKTVTGIIYNGINARAITPDDPLEEELREMAQVGPHDPSTARMGAGVSVGVGVSAEDVDLPEPDEPDPDDQEEPDPEETEDE